MVAYQRTDYMYEKYNAFEVGVGGGGGEYVPQIGFGWSNGVALALLNDLYPGVVANDDRDDDEYRHTPKWEVALIVISVVAVLTFAGCIFYRWHVAHISTSMHAKSVQIQTAHTSNAMHT